MTTRGAPDASKPIDEGADERRAMAAVHHARLADELVDTARALGLGPKP